MRDGEVPLLMTQSEAESAFATRAQMRLKHSCVCHCTGGDSHAQRVLGAVVAQAPRMFAVTRFSDTSVSIGGGVSVAAVSEGRVVVSWGSQVRFFVCVYVFIIELIWDPI